MKFLIKSILPTLPLFPSLFLSLSLASCQKYELARPNVKAAATAENADSTVSNDNSPTEGASESAGPIAESPASSVSAPCVFTKSEGTLVY